MSPLRLGLFASHDGSNLQAIVDSCANGTLDATVTVVIGNNSCARALERARVAGLKTVHLSSKTHPQPGALDQEILSVLVGSGVELVALAGYNKKLGPETVSYFRDRILNIHPAPLPRFGGEGLYGRRVHEAVLASGVKESAATVHLVDELYDHGATVAEQKVPVLVDDTPETLAERVKRAEHALYAATLQRIATGEIDLSSAG